MKVFVYYNLHKHVWSVRALEGHRKGLVIAHEKRILLRDVVGKVSEAGRQRVIREGRKNVHAGMVGTWIHSEREGFFPGREVTYNPYKYTSFVYRDNEQPFERAQYAYLDGRKVEAI